MWGVELGAIYNGVTRKLPEETKAPSWLGHSSFVDAPAAMRAGEPPLRRRFAMATPYWGSFFIN